MKQISFFTILTAVFMFPLLIQAVEVSSQVTAVTLYPNKARETRSGKLSITHTGEQEIIFADISRYIDPQSVQVAIPGVSILSVTSRTNYLGKKTDQAQLKTWKDSLEKVQDERTWLQERIAVAQGELKLYEQNLTVGGDQTSLYPKAVEELATLYKTKTLKIREQLVQLRKEDKSLTEIINKLQTQINTAGGTNQPVQEIVVKTIASKSGQFDYQLQYMVSNAGWKPVYDIHAEQLSQPLKLKMKASIVQQTGYDWKNIQLTLSTAQPQTNQKMPEWRTEFVDFQQVYKMESGALNEVVISASRMEAKSIRSVSVDDSYSVELIESSTAQMYQISRGQNISSTGDAQLVEISAIDMPATFRYETMPKKDPSVYLVAKVAQWESYNLLSGMANIFFEGTYVGQVNIDAKAVKDTLDVSLGRDELVFVERQEVKNVTSKKVIGSSKREDKTFEITVKNNKKSAVDVVVYDQVPVSRQSNIEVTVNDTDKAQYNAETGKLEWTISLKAGESKKIRFSYAIKYPSDKSIIVR